MTTAATGCPMAPDSFNQLLELDEQAVRDAHRHFAELRTAGPVTWVEELQAYAVTGYAEATEVLMDPERFSSQMGDPKGPRINQRLGEVQQRLAARSEEFHELVARVEPDWRHPKCLLTADPPLQTRQRSVVNRLFTPKRVAEIEPRIREIAHELIDGFVERGHADLAAEFGVGLPITVIAEQLGVDTERLADFKRWSDHFVAPIGNDRLTEDDILEMTRSQVEFTEYFLALLEDRRRHPQDDFLTLLLGTGAQDEDDSEASRLSYIAQLLGAGNETSTKMIACGAALLARDADLAASLRAAPDMIPAFVEEVLRLSSPVQGLYRTARHATELAGASIPAGAFLIVWFAAANLDPGVYPEPESAVLGRGNLRNHVAFGRGVHHCVGAPLARSEGVVAFSTLLERVPQWRIAEDLGGEVFERSYLLRGHRHLWVRFDVPTTV